jgi:hypothetical protein
MEIEIVIPETMGTLNLKIARLEQYLRVLSQQQYLSNPYPDHQANLIREYGRLERRLGELIQRRQEFLGGPLAV